MTQPDPTQFYEERLEGASAQQWWREHRSFLENKWKTIHLEWNGDNCVLRVGSNPLCLFGGNHDLTFSFSAGEIESILIREDRTSSLIGAHYYVFVNLGHATIQLDYTPPLFALSQLRHSESLYVNISPNRERKAGS